MCRPDEASESLGSLRSWCSLSVFLRRHCREERDFVARFVTQCTTKSVHRREDLEEQQRHFNVGLEELQDAVDKGQVDSENTRLLTRGPASQLGAGDRRKPGQVELELWVQ